MTEDLPEVLAERTAVLLRAVLTRAETMGEDALRPVGVSGREYGVLVLLAYGRAPESQGRLGAILGLDRTTTMKLMAGLVDRGLVRRDPDLKDRRSYRLAITASGRRVATRADRALTACDAALTEERLTPEETRQLQDFLRRLT